MEYKIIDWTTANNLKNSLKAKFKLMVESTKAQLFQLKDGTYLLMPINPFGNSIHIMDKAVFDNWVSTNEFPIADEGNKWYAENKPLIDNLIQNKEQLKKDLLEFVYNEKDYSSIQLSEAVMDEIFDCIKKKRKMDKYRLNFIILAGDYLMKGITDFKWGLLKSYQLINPIYSISIIQVGSELKFYDLETAFFGKWGYSGMQYFEKTFKSSFRPIGELDEIIFLKD